jgi:Double zinc ribbon
MFCPKCGSQNTAANRFCLGCGAPLVAASPALAEPAQREQAPPASRPQTANVSFESGAIVEKVCPLCDRTYPAAQRFCNADGTSLVAPAPPPNPVLQKATPSKASAPPSPPKSAVEAPELQEVAPAPAAIPEPASSVTPEPAPIAKIFDSPTVTEQPVATAAILDRGPVSEGLTCPKCSLPFPPGVRFCDQDGSTLVSKAAAEAALALAAKAPPAQFEEPAWDSDWNVAVEKRRGRGLLIFSLLALAVLIAGGGYAYWSGMLNKWIGGKADPALVADAAKAGAAAKGSAKSAPAAPGLRGTYRARLSDQDISLVIEGESVKPLVSSAGLVTYLNVVTGATCTAALVPVSGGGVGGDTSNAVSFRQGPVPDKPACPKDIPVKMDITGQPTGDDGVVTTIAAEWLRPDSGAVLMAGTLTRDAGQ